MRRYFADTTAMIIFSTLIGAFIEIIIVGLTVQQSLMVRLSAVPVMLLAGRPYGIYRNWLFRCMRGKQQTALTHTMLDTFANLSFQSTLYAALLALNSASLQQVIEAVLVVAVVNIFVGRPYGLFLDFWRKLLNVEPR